MTSTPNPLTLRVWRRVLAFEIWGPLLTTDCDRHTNLPERESGRSCKPRIKAYREEQSKFFRFELNAWECFTANITPLGDNFVENFKKSCSSSICILSRQLDFWINYDVLHCDFSCQQFYYYSSLCAPRTFSCYSQCPLSSHHDKFLTLLFFHILYQTCTTFSTSTSAVFIFDSRPTEKNGIQSASLPTVCR